MKLARMKRYLVSASSVAVASFLALPAHAQISGSAAVGETANAPSASASAQDASAPQNDIVVTGRRAAIQNATARKQNADTVIDSIVADEAGKLPDTSLT